MPTKNGSVRICIDLTHLNEVVCTERYILPSVDQTIGSLAGAKVFSKLDANRGYWQIPVSPESSLYTTFITPFGRFRFNRWPFGIASAPEHFQRRMSMIIDGYRESYARWMISSNGEEISKTTTSDYTQFSTSSRKPVSHLAWISVSWAKVKSSFWVTFCPQTECNQTQTR